MSPTVLPVLGRLNLREPMTFGNCIRVVQSFLHRRLWSVVKSAGAPGVDGLTLIRVRPWLVGWSHTDPSVRRHQKPTNASGRRPLGASRRFTRLEAGGNRDTAELRAINCKSLTNLPAGNLMVALKTFRLNPKIQPLALHRKEASGLYGTQSVQL
jgi:hypothetical protein